LGYFRLEKDRAHFTPLAEAEEGRPTVLTTDLQGWVIVEGRYGLKDGDEVSVRAQATEQEEQAGSSK
jgi:hypothetical protein